MLAVLVTGLVGVPLSRAEAVTQPRTLYAEQPVSAGPVEPGFPIDAVGVVFDLPAGADHEDAGRDVAIRFRDAGRWGPWQEVGEDGAQQPGRWTGALVDGHDADAYQVRGVPAGAARARAAALNTTDGPQVVVGHRPAGAAQATVPCKSRADWGADESLRSSSRAYAPLQVTTVHHTANDNQSAASDPDALVRAIYRYHTQTNGWGDIGYQALIAPDGTLYEGRWSGSDSRSCLSGGGTGWDFGHQTIADDAAMVTGAHTGGYNTGNFGIALLGTYSDVAPTAVARDALVSYLAEVAQRHQLDPASTVAYDNGVNAATAEAISGHRDFSATDCPGGVLYADLPNIRTAVAAALATNASPTVSITSPTAADVYTLTEPAPGSGVHVDFVAGATDETPSDDLTWVWTDDAGASLATTSAFTAHLDVGSVTLTASATDPNGATGQDTITVNVLAADATSTVDDVASGERSVSGTIFGSYPDTRSAGGGAEAITEVESGGKPSTRTSMLEHVWTVPVTGGASVTLFVDVTTSDTGDGDSFAFRTSTDGGATWSDPVLTLPPGSAGVYTASLPPATSGSLDVQVTDTDRSSGNRTLDTLTVDHLFVRSDQAGSSSAPTAPTDLAASSSSATTVDLSWPDVADEYGYDLERSVDGGTSWVAVAGLAADTVSHQDTRLTAATTYRYRLRAYNAAGASVWATSNDVTTAAVAAIGLSAQGWKDKGEHVIDLSWTGATDVVVTRDGEVIWRGTGSGYLDRTGAKGSAAYVYQVCSTTSGTCSDPVTVTF